MTESAALSRRGFLSSASLVAGAAVTATGFSAQAADHEQDDAAAEVMSRVEGGWTPLRLVRPQHMDWQPDGSWDAKFLFRDPESGAHLIMLKVPPGWEGGLHHYHEWHEWAYVLSGDLTNDEFVSPDQYRGSRFQFREGHFLSRPPYSMHGTEPGGLRSQIGCTLLIQEEGPSSLTFGAAPGAPAYDSERVAEVTHWASPRLLDTIGDMRWDDMNDMPGVKVKYLMDNANFRARLHWIPAGFEGGSVPALAQPAYRPSGRQFNYMLFGDLTRHAWAAPGATPQAMTATVDQMFDIGPNCISALAPGVATTEGCVWLQVEYGDARGIVSEAVIPDSIAV